MRFPGVPGGLGGEQQRGMLCLHFRGQGAFRVFIKTATTCAVTENLLINLLIAVQPAPYTFRLSYIVIKPKTFSNQLIPILSHHQPPS